MKNKKTKNLRFVITCCTLFVCIFATTIAHAKDYSFSWSANPEPVEGYKLYYKKGGTPSAPFSGTDATNGSSPIDIGKKTIFTITGLEDNTTYHFSLAAYNGSDESDFSEIITVFPPDSSSPAVPSPVPTISNIRIKTPVIK